MEKFTLKFRNSALNVPEQEMQKRNKRFVVFDESTTANLLDFFRIMIIMKRNVT